MQQNDMSFSKIMVPKDFQKVSAEKAISSGA